MCVYKRNILCLHLNCYIDIDAYVCLISFDTYLWNELFYIFIRPSGYSYNPYLSETSIANLACSLCNS